MDFSPNAMMRDLNKAMVQPKKKLAAMTGREKKLLHMTTAVNCKRKRSSMMSPLNM